MKTFRRKKSRELDLQDRFVNSFYKTGFINEELMNTSERDIWPHIIDMLSDCNVSTIFSTILVGFREIPYDEEILQSVIFDDSSNKKKRVSGEVFATTQIINCKFYQCLFILSPLNWGKANKKHAIGNTIKRLKEDYMGDYYILPHVMKFLENQYRIHEAEKDDKEDLFVNANPVTLLVPLLQDGKYYKMDGVKMYPYLSEEYHYYKTKFNQTRFIFKRWGKAKKKKDGKEQYLKESGYFDKGQMLTVSEETGELIKTEVFYVKFGSFMKFYNPFMFFEVNEIESLMEELYKEDLNEEVKTLLRNTFDAYIENVALVRDTNGNNIPDITIYKEKDTFYDNVISDYLSTLTPDEDEDGNIQEEDPTELIESLKAEEEAELKEKVKTKQTWTVSRKMISLKLLKSLILGYNGKKYYSFYPHLGDALLKTKNMNDRKRSGGTMIPSTLFPRSLQVYVTIKSNTDLFTSYSNTNPIDMFELTAYKKNIVVDPDAAENSSASKAKTEDKYLTDEEYGIIDSWTVKSEKTAGLVAVLSGLKCHEDCFNFNK